MKAVRSKRSSARQPKRSAAVVRSKAGLNFVRTIVEKSGSVFIKVDQEDDLGIDGIIELVVDGLPAHRSFAVQIKSGASYFDRSTNECIFPVGHHRDYWLRHPLPTVGIVFVPALRACYWFDLKRALRACPEKSTLRLPAFRQRVFSTRTFSRIFVPMHLTGRSKLSVAELCQYCESPCREERDFGFHQLFRSHPDRPEVWDLLVSHLRERDHPDLVAGLPFYLAHVPWHGDLGADGSHPVVRPLRDRLLAEYERFERSEIIKLLRFIDPEEGISRGTMGQSVEAVVAAIPGFAKALADIARDAGLDMRVRESAAFICAMHTGKEAAALFRILSDAGSSYATDLYRFVSDHGRIFPY